MPDQTAQLEAYLRAIQTISQGGKISLDDFSADIIAYLEKIFLILHANGDIPYEPVALIAPPNATEHDLSQLSKTSFFPHMVHHVQQMRIIIGRCMRSGQYPLIKFPALSDFPIGREFRNAGSGSAIPIFFAAHPPALLKALEVIIERISKADSAPQHPPIMIFDPYGIVPTLLANSGLNFDMLNGLGVHIRKDERSLAEQINALSPKMTNNHPIPSRNDAPITTFIVATTDPNKTANISAALGGGRRVSYHYNVFGKTQSPPEETASFVGNAHEKFIAAICHILNLSDEEIHEHLSKSMIYPHAALIVAHDGGLGFCLEKRTAYDSITRKTNIFDQSIFASIMHKMRRRFMIPGVELAHAIRSLNTRVFFKKLEESVKLFCSQNPIFERSDLRAYDSASMIGISLACVLEVKKLPISMEEKIKLIIAEATHAHHTEILKVSDQPRGMAVGNEPSTQDYLMRGNGEDTIAEHPHWRVQSATAMVTRTLMSLMEGLKPYTRPLCPEFSLPDVPLFFACSLIPANVRPAVATDETSIWHQIVERMKKLYPHALGLGKHFKAYHNPHLAPRDRFKPEGHLLDNIRDEILKLVLKGGVHYFGESYFPANHPDPYQKTHQSIASLLYLCRAIVAKQLQHDIRPVVLAEAYSEFLEHVAVLQSEGLLTPDLQQLMRLCDRNNAAETIVESLRSPHSRSIVTPIQGYMLEQIERCAGKEDHDCFTVTLYCSATNENKFYQEDLYNLGCYLARNGCNLKIGGGNMGLMRAAAQGFIEERRKLSQGSNKLIICQYTETMAIEGLFELQPGDEQHAVIRIHDTLEEREADLSDANLEIAGAGGLGTTMEMLNSIRLRCSVKIDPAQQKLILLGHARSDDHEKDRSVHRGFLHLMNSCGIDMSLLGIEHTPKTEHIYDLIKALGDEFLGQKLHNAPIGEQCFAASVLKYG